MAANNIVKFYNKSEVICVNSDIEGSRHRQIAKPERSIMMKRKTALLLALIMIFALFAGCSKPETGTESTPTEKPTTPATATAAPEKTAKPEQSAEPTPDSPYNFAAGKFESDETGAALAPYEYELPISATDEVITLWTFSYTPQVIPEEGYAAMPLPKKDIELTGINVEYILPPLASRKENLSVLIAADEVPDMCSGAMALYNGTPIQMVEDGYFINFYDYIEYIPNYSYLTKNYDPEDTDTYQKSYYFDDFIPAMYTLMQEPMRYSSYCMRGDWLDKLGITNDDIVTWDDLYDVLVLMKTQISTAEFPWVLRNTIDLTTGPNFMSYDTIPLIVSGAIGKNYVVDGQVKISNMNDNDREVISLFRKFYADGLITPNWTAISRGADCVDELNNGEFGYSSMNAAETTTYAQSNIDPDCRWVPTQPPVRYPGQIVHLGGENPRIYYGNTSVSAKCKNIPLALSWLDWRYSPTGSDLWDWGLEGEVWNYNEEGKREATEFALHHPDGLSYSYVLLVYAINNFADAGITTLYKNFAFEGGANAQAVCEYWTNWLETYHDGSYIYPPGARLVEEQTNRLNRVIADVSTFMNENYTLFIMGDKNIDAEWDNYVEGLYDAGIQVALDVYQEAYDEFTARQA